MSDAYVYAVENSDDFDGVPVDVAVVQMCIRDRRGHDPRGIIRNGARDRGTQPLYS